jgi:putative transposase
MTNRFTIFVEGGYYHIYNRGNSKQNIFLDDQDRDRFVKLLYLCNSKISFNFREDIVKQKIDAFDFDREGEIVSIGAWVLMPNHFHLYITPCPRCHLGQDKEVSCFMKKLCTSYSMYFNKRHERTGKLFEGVFKSVHIETDEHAKYNFSYIHLNPVKLIDQNWKENGVKNIKKTLQFLDKYKWSSYPDYKGIRRPENKIISPQDFPDYFSDKKVFEEEIFDWLNYSDNLQQQ